MTQDKLEKLFELCNELYADELQKSGMTTMPFCWSQSLRSGSLIVFSAFGSPSRDVAEKLGINLSI
jgi:hypothetical protein